MRGDEVISIRGDERDGFSRGFICAKGPALKQLHEDPDRLRAPLVRRGDDPSNADWEVVTWDEAFAEVERRLMPVIETYGRDAVALYFGNPNVHNLAGTIYTRPLAKGVGTRNIFSASTVDQMPKHVSCGLMFGSPDAIPVPDLDRSDFVLMLGANPWESNGSLCTAPDFAGRLRTMQARGGRFVVVDPRRTRTAEHADEHVPIRPGTDAHLLMAMIQVLFEEKLVRVGRLHAHVAGVERVRESAEPFTPERVSQVTSVPASTIRRLARELAQHERAVVYGRIGTHTVEFGTIASWAVDVLNALSGHLDTPGGAMWPLPAHARPGTGKPGRGFKIGRWRSRVKGFREVRGELPVATLADEIETPGDGQIRALITVAGNPLLSTPHSERLDRAMRGLACVVCVDPYRNETTRHAHVILPPPSSLARSQYELVFMQLAVRNFAKWSAPVVSHDGPSEEDILAKLALIASGQGARADPAFVHALVEHTLLERAIENNPALTGKGAADLAAKLEAKNPIDRAVEILVRAGVSGDQFGAVPGGLTFGKLRENPHGIDLGPLEPRVPEVLETPSGKIELAPDLVLEDVDRLVAALDRAPNGALLLIGRRHLRSNNSWMHNVEPLVRGRERCTLQIHPDDAARLGLRSGGFARVASRVGELVAPVEVTERVMPGVVSLPHGWGHGVRGTGLGIAAEHPGVNSNRLTDPDCLDPLSGNAVLNGIPVEVTSQPIERRS